MSIEIQTCLSCAEIERRAGEDIARLERELERAERDKHFLEREKEEAFLRVQELEFHNRRLEGEVFKLRTKEEEPQGKRGTKEQEEIKEWLHAWDDIRMMIPGARKVKPTTLGPQSSNARVVRAARAVWDHEELMECLKGAQLSNWHTESTDRFSVQILIGQSREGQLRDDKIKKHIDRWRHAERLRKSGIENEEFIRNVVQKKLPDLEVLPFTKLLECPGCESDPCRCGLAVNGHAA